MLKTLREEYLKQQKKLRDELQKNPSSPTSKKAGRTAGAIFFILGLALLLANWITWNTQGRVLKWAVAAMLTFLMVGVWLMITGTLPQKKR